MKLFGFDFVRELKLLQKVRKKADLPAIDENPLINSKVLYGTGHMRMNITTGLVERIKALRYTIKEGIVYDSQQLLADVAFIFARKKETELASS